MFDLNIENRTFILFTIPILSALVNYITISHLINFLIIDEAIRNIQIKKHPKLHRNLLEILSLPTFFESLNFKYKVNQSFKTEIKFVILSIIIVLLPFIFLICAQVYLIFEYYNDYKIIIVLGSLYLSFKSIKSLLSLLKFVQ